MPTLTPPHHFSIVCCSPYAHSTALGDPDSNDEILYRGSIPAIRNFPFLKRLGLRTIVILQKKAPGDGDALVRWSARHKVELVWVKAEKMTEESLGLGRNQVGDVLKTMLDPSAYPLYIADRDGISHTTLLVSCLRKLQGWSSESILDEITRFEPDHEDMPLVPFITSYLGVGPSTEPLLLPSPPLPSWLWPITTQTATGTTPEKAPSAPSSVGITPSRSNNSLNKETRERETSTSKSGEKEKEPKEKDRERTPSVPATVGALPFPHPLSSRKHPTMKITFPSTSTAAVNTSMPPPPIPPYKGGGDKGGDAPPKTPTLGPNNPGLSRVNSRRDTRSVSATATREEDQSLVAAATSILSATLVTLGIGTDEGQRKSGEAVESGSLGSSPPRAGSSQQALAQRRESMSQATSPPTQRWESPSQTLSAIINAGQVSRSAVGGAGLEMTTASGDVPMPRTQSISDTNSDIDLGSAASDTGGSALIGASILSAGEEVTDSPEGEPEEILDGEAGEEVEETEEEEDEEEDEEDEDEDSDTDLQPTSLHISALDLAGYG